MGEPNIRLPLLISKIESNHKNNVFGDNGKAWGLYQFHKPRWNELSRGKYKWGKATSQEQTEILMLEFHVCHPKNLVEFLNYHNLGHKSNKITPYVRKALYEARRIYGKVR